MLQDRAIGCLFLGLSLLLWFVILPREIPGEEQLVYPRLTVLFIAIPSLLMILRGGRGAVRPRTSPEHGGAHVGLRVFALILLMALCIALTGFLGFFVANFLCAICYMRFFGERSLARVVLVPAVLLGAIWLIVVRLLHYPLPQGILF